MRYRDYVNARKIRNPCLTGLADYLARPELPQSGRIVGLDFVTHSDNPSCSDLTVPELEERLKIKAVTEQFGDIAPVRLGQLIIIEDISPGLIELVGSKLDIDPLFFASYVYTPWRSSKFTTPQLCCLPSRQRVQEFVPLAYHRCLSFIDSKPAYGNFLRDTNQFRKVSLLPEATEPSVGFAQHVCAAYLKKHTHNWTGIVLVDPPMGNRYRSSGRTGSQELILQSRPYLGGPEDFCIDSDIAAMSSGSEMRPIQGMADELVYHWSHTISPSFDPSSPSLQALMYLPLNLVAAEWVNYISVMSFSLKHYEASNITANLEAELNRLSASLRTLQTWRRRVLASMEKINPVVHYLAGLERNCPGSNEWMDLRKDYEFIGARIEGHGQRLEAMIPVATSFIQLVESRRALLETGNVTRLTVLAMVFIPLSFIASLFSMSDPFGPGGARFWLYFAISLPVTLIVLCVARPPMEWPKKVQSWKKGVISRF